MKILFVHPNLSRYAYKQIYALSKKEGIETYLLCGKLDVSVYNINYLKESCQKIWQDLPTLRYPYQYRFVTKKIRSIIDEHKIDLIHVYSMPDDLTVAAIKSESAPVVFCLRDLTSTFSKDLLASRVFPQKIISNKLLGTIPKYIVYKYVLSMEKKAMEKSSARVFSTPCMLEYAQNRYKIKNDNLIFLNFILKEELPSLTREKISEKIGGVHIGFAGNINIFDSYRNFLPFFVKLAKEKIHVHMHVVSKDRKSLFACKEAAGKNEYLHFYPPMDPPKMMDALTLYDFGILPFENEQNYYDTILPNKLFDYISAGVPIITSNVHCIKEFIAEHNLGFYYNDFDDLIVKLKTVTATDFKIDRSEFFIDKHLEKLITFYERLGG